jgi:hypothetical protein
MTVIGSGGNALGQHRGANTGSRTSNHSVFQE